MMAKRNPCLNVNGTPKQAFETFNACHQALMALTHSAGRNISEFRVYQCKRCRKFHYGHRRIS
jgi:hypothetical protein